MGIRNLKTLLDRYCRFAITTRKLEAYRGMRLGIDLSIFLYKYLYNNNDHIEGLTRLILRLLKNQITPIFIFDGKPPKEKDDTLVQRKERKDFMTIKRKIFENVSEFEKKDFESFRESVIEEANHMSSTMNNTSFLLSDNDINELYQKSTEDIKKDVEKLNKKIIHVTHEHIESSKELFDLFGVKYIHEQCEAESLMAYMCKMNYIDGCISEDTDILANGGCLFLRNFNADKDFVDEYCLEGILDGLDLNHDQFIDLCILCGCDYTSKIHGLGPVGAHKLIKTYGTIEEIIHNNKTYIVPDNFDYQRARCLFKEPVSGEIFSRIKKDNFVEEPRINLLMSFFKKRSEINQKYIKEKTLREIKNNLMNYFLNIRCSYEFDDVSNNNETSLKKNDTQRW